MAAEFRIDVHGRDGVLRAQLVGTSAGGSQGGYLWLTCAMAVNSPGLLQFGLSGQNSAIALLELDGEIVLQRRNLALGVSWTVEFRGLFRGIAFQTDDRGQERCTVSCPGALSLLDRRIIAYHEGVANRSSFTGLPAETIMRLLVLYNCTDQATVANGRLRTGFMPEMTVESDRARGASIPARTNGKKNLLEELQELAVPGGIDFDLVPVAPHQWVFRVYAGQRGTDRRAEVLFSATYDNIVQPSYSDDRQSEKTVGIVGGQGEGTARQIVVRTGPEWSSENDIETWIDAGSALSEPELESIGDQQLAEYQSLPEIRFGVRQTAQTTYGKHYFLGDLVRGQHRGGTADYQVAGVTIGYAQDGREQIEVDLRFLRMLYTPVLPPIEPIPLIPPTPPDPPSTTYFTIGTSVIGGGDSIQ